MAVVCVCENMLVYMCLHLCHAVSVHVCFSQHVICVCYCTFSFAYTSLQFELVWQECWCIWSSVVSPLMISFYVCDSAVVLLCVSKLCGQRGHVVQSSNFQRAVWELKVLLLVLAVSHSVMTVRFKIRECIMSMSVPITTVCSMCARSAADTVNESTQTAGTQMIIMSAH